MHFLQLTHDAIQKERRVGSIKRGAVFEKALAITTSIGSPIYNASMMDNIALVATEMDITQLNILDAHIKSCRDDSLLLDVRRPPWKKQRYL
jgi:hypothetical protein